MRIVGGQLGGRVFHSRGFGGRPTMDRAKESLFNVLSNRVDLEGLSVVDLFAGTGAIGFEFASRGAEHVVLVEANRKHAREIVRNAGELRLSNVEVVTARVESWLKRAEGNRYDLVFADPPYALGLVGELPGMIRASALLRPGGLLIVEHSPGQEFSGFTPSFARQYGDAEFSFFLF